MTMDASRNGAENPFQYAPRARPQPENAGEQDRKALPFPSFFFHF